MENLSGQHIDRYEILELLGRGGMAMVYRAYDSRLEREVAIKIIRRDAFPPENLHDVLKRFEREAKSLARLSHPNIVKVLDYGEYEGSPYLVLEYFSGGTLKQKIGEPMSWQDVARLILPIARGIDYAHKRGVVHRDIKPANILLTENGEPTLSDFGIAKLFLDEKATTLTGSGAAIGTPEYMAPEQWTGQTSPKSDMYSLGVVFYELVTGRRPYIADTPGGVFLKQVTEPLMAPREIVPSLPETVEQFLLRTLAKEPADRYADLETLANTLESLLSKYDTQTRQFAETGPRKGSDPKPIPESPVSSISNPLHTYRRILISGGIGLAILIFLIVGFLQLQKRPAVLPSETQPISIEHPSPTFAATSLPPTFTFTPEPLHSESIVDSKDVPMVLVPAGNFIMGSTAEQALASCQSVSSDCEANWFKDDTHTVFLDSYYIDKYEVTNVRYRACVTAGECQPPNDISSAKNEFYYAADSPYDNYPVINVDWNMAKTYCEWREARLPTEAEWEKAARGTDGRTYPWGEGIDPTYANYHSHVGDTTPVGDYEKGKSIYGVYDMVGNVREWVSDWYLENYFQNSPASNPQGPSLGTSRVVRGSSWYYEVHKIGGSLLHLAFRISMNPASYNGTLGFRCAKDASR